MKIQTINLFNNSTALKRSFIWETVYPFFPGWGQINQKSPPETSDRANEQISSAVFFYDNSSLPLFATSLQFTTNIPSSFSFNVSYSYVFDDKTGLINEFLSEMESSRGNSSTAVSYHYGQLQDGGPLLLFNVSSLWDREKYSNMTFLYDDEQRLVESFDNEQISWVFTYDSDGNIQAMSGRDGVVLNFYNK